MGYRKCIVNIKLSPFFSLKYMSYTTLPIDQRYFNFRCRMVGPFLERAALLPTIRGKSNQIGDPPL